MDFLYILHVRITNEITLDIEFSNRFFFQPSVDIKILELQVIRMLLFFFFFGLSISHQSTENEVLYLLHSFY